MDEEEPVPSFDIISEVSLHEVANAVDQASRELASRFDFKGAKASFALEKDAVTMKAPSEFQLGQMMQMLTGRLSKRGIDVRCLKIDPPSVNVAEATQVVTVRQGIETELARKIVKLIKDEKMKVQPSIQGEKVRVTGKNRDDLQLVIAMIKKADLEYPLQFDNYRD